VLADAVIVLAILLKTVLRLVEIPGTTAIAPSVTSAAIKAYSIMSWPRVSLQIPSFNIAASRWQNNQAERIYLSTSCKTTLFVLDLRVANFAQVVNRMIKTVYLRLMLKNASGEWSSVSASATGWRQSGNRLIAQT
jgi:hypothetical protein